MKFDDVSAAYRQAVLSVIGSHLLKLDFFNCKDIDVAAELFLCSNLEDLLISNKSTVSPISTESAIPAEHFLPDLKIVKLTSCFPYLQRLFEAPRPSLTNTTFNCIHFGIREASSCLWTDLPQLWSNLEVFFIQAQSRSINSIEDVHQMRSAIRKLVNIKQICIPYQHTETEEFLKEIGKELKAFLIKSFFICFSQNNDVDCMYP